MSERRVRVRVTGSVQGVFFREATRREAERLGLSGWTRNLFDGRVEAEFQGTSRAVERVIEFCHHGPVSANVDDVEVLELDSVLGDEGFTIR